jgi:Xaa-Pro aminopeptidase
MGATARLFFTDSEADADLYYLTGFLAGDPFLFLEQGGKRSLFLTDLEVDRGRKQSRVEEVVRLEEVIDAVKETDGNLADQGYPRVGRLICHIAEERGIGSFEVSGKFPVALGDILRQSGFDLAWQPAPFIKERARKQPEEVELIRAAVIHTEAAMNAAIDQIRNAEIKDGVLYEKGEPLTSERVRRTIDLVFLDRNCRGANTIVAGGDQGVDPHERGHGPLPANLPIILDIFPRDLGSRYCGDMTRTVVKGRASDEAKKMFDSVRRAKEKAESLLMDGVDGHDVHEAVRKAFLDDGFETGQKSGRMVGFFHGTGHGLGLDVHEFPRIAGVHETMREGYVVTVEPGLYYPGLGGVRIEDDVLIAADGCENLCTLDAFLEV